MEGVVQKKTQKNFYKQNTIVKPFINSSYKNKFFNPKSASA